MCRFGLYWPSGEPENYQWSALHRGGGPGSFFVHSNPDDITKQPVFESVLVMTNNLRTAVKPRRRWRCEGVKQPRKPR